MQLYQRHDMNLIGMNLINPIFIPVNIQVDTQTDIQMDIQMDTQTSTQTSTQIRGKRVGQLSFFGSLSF